MYKYLMPEGYYLLNCYLMRTHGKWDHGCGDNG
jgi:hypothetical protein